MKIAARRLEAQHRPNSPVSFKGWSRDSAPRRHGRLGQLCSTHGEDHDVAAVRETVVPIIFSAGTVVASERLEASPSSKRRVYTPSVKAVMFVKNATPISKSAVSIILPAVVVSELIAAVSKAELTCLLENPSRVAIFLSSLSCKFHDFKRFVIRHSRTDTFGCVELNERFRSEWITQHAHSDTIRNGITFAKITVNN